MGPAPREVVVISSSDEEEEVLSGRSARSPVPLGWAAKLGDSAVPAPRRHKGRSRAVRAGNDGDCEGDDCVVLDGDPDKPVAVAGAKGRSRGDGLPGEVEIVAVKGEIACKDFPHLRHSCSELPFSTTSHTKHCSMCYCFVCDAPAPCKYWGKGLLNDDHCHATDKETKWKILRQAFKCKSVPASYPEERLNVVYQTTPSPRQQEYYEEYTPEGYSETDEEATVCIGNLPYDIDEKDLVLLFKDVGIVVFSEIIYDRETGESRGYGFVTMSTAEEAKKAVEMYNRREMDGRPLTVYKTAATRGARTEETPSPHPSRPVSSSFKIYVDNLPWKVSNSNLKQLFSDYGEVVGAKVVYHRGREAGRSPFGFVAMATRQESENAIWHLNKQVWWGRKLRVRVAREEERKVKVV
ncbi:31 kDa ribonucleoprotein, chloroplastic-like [Triticum dicoccoides]|uniref:RRM domain-containing protein n=3 Tax=Triticum TaxID=4564 RepID=A0A9R0RT58_TRITD|nr:31 kDa ribonucleoprotein, chloroplastic-like [Triticum dicoccoides]XP_044342084.1 31 kDa ribonucleoprotein, chloroplastic-like [Triticum aestivum]VAH66294.1 unnamed protein product [Triticum turgidum subsp. durum]